MDCPKHANLPSDNFSTQNREHSYRQILDISSGGRTLIKEKTEMFNRLDVEENLVIMMLMLPSANRLNKDTLKVFRDAGGFTDFFLQRITIQPRVRY